MSEKRTVGWKLFSEFLLSPICKRAQEHGWELWAQALEVDGDRWSRTSPQHVCWGDSGHVAVRKTGQNAAVLKELLLSRLDSHIWKILPDLPSRAILASPSPLGLYIVLGVSRAEHRLSTLASCLPEFRVTPHPESANKRPSTVKAPHLRSPILFEGHFTPKRAANCCSSSSGEIPTWS